MAPEHPSSVVQLPGTEEATHVDQKKLPGEWSDVYWKPPRGGLSWSQYGQIVEAKRGQRNARERKLQTDLWQMADLLNWGLMEFGQSFYQLFDERHYTRESLGNIARIGEHFEIARRWRPDRVSFWTHADVIPVDKKFDDPTVGDDLLSRYARDEIDRQDLRDAVAGLLGKKASGSGDSGESSKTQDSLLDTCPLCDGLGEVAPDRRIAYLREEGYSMEEARELSAAHA